jgi:hypothetical protein
MQKMGVFTPWVAKIFPLLTLMQKIRNFRPKNGQELVIIFGFGQDLGYK